MTFLYKVCLYEAGYKKQFLCAENKFRSVFSLKLPKQHTNWYVIPSLCCLQDLTSLIRSPESLSFNHESHCFTDCATEETLSLLRYFKHGAFCDLVNNNRLKKRSSQN